MVEIDLKGCQMVHISKKGEGILREKRVVQGLTQQQVADKAGIKLQQYQKFESGERNIKTASFQIACRVIEALGMNISDFYHDEYIFGEKVFLDSEGLKYEKTRMLINADVK